MKTSFYLSLYSCWLPRNILFQRSITHSNFSTKSISSQKSSNRSHARFSVKVARFLFLKRRIQLDASESNIASLSTHVHHQNKGSHHSEMHLLARNFLSSIEPGKFFKQHQLLETGYISFKNIVESFMKN